jgi:hypothetical protein
MIEGALADLRRNQWILDDIFGGLENDQLSQEQYGYKVIKAAKDWFMSNEIKVYMHYRMDNLTYPSITIDQAPAEEMLERTAFADDGVDEDFDPRKSGLMAARVYPPFTPSQYDPSTGRVKFPKGIKTDLIVPGQFLVSARSGKAYQILSCISTTEFTISPNIKDDFTGAYITPPTALWNLRREQTFFRETYQIGCHAQSDVVQGEWMRQLVAYILLRYKEVYLEARGFEVSTIRVGNVDINPHFEAERVFSSLITLSGQVEASWIKYVAPKLQSVRQKIVIADGPKTPDGYQDLAQNQGWVMEGDLDGLPAIGDCDED